MFSKNPLFLFLKISRKIIFASLFPARSVSHFCILLKTMLQTVCAPPPWCTIFGAAAAPSQHQKNYESARSCGAANLLLYNQVKLYLTFPPVQRSSSARDNQRRVNDSSAFSRFYTILIIWIIFIKNKKKVLFFENF